ncbi:MAG: metal ABC transporter substrate-binding protein [Parvibaculum sp.]|nr:metal ABC transporter substrate-binding protein [Parvibaculum sp.]
MTHVKTLCAALALMLAAIMPTTPASAQAEPQTAERLKVVTSFSILGDMTREVAGGLADVQTLVGPDGDAHSFEPGPADAKALAGADVLILNGLGFEPWMIRLAAAAHSKAKYVTASYGINPRRMAQEKDSAGADHDEDGYPRPAHDFDPHAWQNLQNGMTYVQNIADGLAAADPGNALTYQANAETYIRELKTLETWVKKEIAKVPREKRKVITTHDAFGYFGDAYGVEFLAPVGVSNEAEPSARALARLIDQIRKEKIKAIFIENMSDPRMMETIARETGAKEGGTLYSDALSPADGPAPAYVAVFRHNVSVLVSAMQKN